MVALGRSCCRTHKLTQAQGKQYGPAKQQYSMQQPRQTVALRSAETAFKLGLMMTVGQRDASTFMASYM